MRVKFWIVCLCTCYGISKLKLAKICFDVDLAVSLCVINLWGAFFIFLWGFFSWGGGTSREALDKFGGMSSPSSFAKLLRYPDMPENQKD